MTTASLKYSEAVAISELFEGRKGLFFITISGVIGLKFYGQSPIRAKGPDGLQLQEVLNIRF